MIDNVYSMKPPWSVLETTAKQCQFWRYNAEGLSLLLLLILKEEYLQPIKMYIYIYYPPPKKNLWGIMIKAPSFRLCFRPSVRDLSVLLNISNTNEYFFPLLYTCIYYNHPVKFRQEQIQNGRLIAIFVCSNWQNI